MASIHAEQLVKRQTDGLSMEISEQEDKSTEKTAKPDMIGGEEENDDDYDEDYDDDSDV